MKKQSVIWSALLLATINTASVAASNYPQLKPGLWETTTNMHGKDITMQQCIDPKTLAGSEKTADDYAKKNCSAIRQNKSGNLYTSEMTCKVNGKTIITKVETTLISENEVKSKMTSIRDGKTEVMQNHVKRISDCAATGAAGGVEGSIRGKDGKMHSFDEMVKQAQAEAKKHKN